MPRQLEPDRGAGSTRVAKRGEMLGGTEFDQRERDRQGLAELDQMIEGNVELSRAAKDRERALPRTAAAEVSSRKVRPLPTSAQPRKPLSSRQQKARSVVKNAVQDRTPQTQYNAVSRLTTEDGWRRSINDALADNVGDAQALSDRDRAEAQRLDRFIQSYERNNDRGHVVYVNAEMPAAVNRGNVEGFVANQFHEGQTVAFDRYSFGSHNLDEVEPRRSADATPVYEIQTSRGAYLGGSDRSNNAAHLLPRGMRMRVVGQHWADFQRPDGTAGRRLVIQLTDN